MVDWRYLDTLLIGVSYYVNLFYLSNFNPLSANPEKWSNTLKQIVGNLPTICLSVFDHFMNLALKGLNKEIQFNSIQLFQIARGVSK